MKRGVWLKDGGNITVDIPDGSLFCLLDTFLKDICQDSFFEYLSKAIFSSK